MVPEVTLLSITTLKFGRILILLRCFFCRHLPDAGDKVTLHLSNDAANREAVVYQGASSGCGLGRRHCLREQKAVTLDC